MQPLWKTVWRVLKKLGIKPPFFGFIQQSHSWAYTLRKPKLKKTHVSHHSVQFSSSVASDSLQPLLQHARLPSPSPTPGACSNSCPSSRWCHPTVSSSVVPSPPVFSLSQHQGLFPWVSSLHQVAKVLKFLLQHKSFQWTLRTDFL